MDATGPEPKRWLSVREAAESLGLGRSSIYELVKAKKLACHHLGPNGGRIRFKQADLDAYAERTRSGPKPSAPQLPRRAPYVAKYLK